LENRLNITNRLGLPNAIVRAIQNDKYSPGDGDISVTSLIQPPQLKRLLRDHHPDEDASDKIWALLGQAVHSILERHAEGHPDVEVEKRLYTMVEGWKVGGQFDEYERGVATLRDYKITTVYAADGKDEWTQQLNMLRLLCIENGRPVEKMEIVAIFRDWQKNKAAHDKEYPDSQVKVIPIEVWPLDRTRGFMEGRVLLHQAQTPRPCTDEERWTKPEKFAVMKVGRKAALKLFDSFNDAQAFIDKSSDKKLLDIQHRPKTHTRCEGYCAAAPICPQLQREREAAPF
jgi:hypothetical protein